MTDKEKVKILSHCFDEVIWMAIRYADGMIGGVSFESDYLWDLFHKANE